jgi:hypothetical protein
MEDNKSVIIWSESKTGPEKLTNHLFWIRDMVTDKTIKLIYCIIYDQVADAFTKAFPPSQFESLIMRE